MEAPCCITSVARMNKALESALHVSFYYKCQREFGMQHQTEYTEDRKEESREISLLVLTSMFATLKSVRS